MTDFSPLDSALYESTPEKIAASLRYLRKADAVMAALMPLSASTQAPPAAVAVALRGNVKAVCGAVEAMRTAGGSREFQAAFDAAKVLAAALAGNKNKETDTWCDS